jgi:hypothetical protein
VYSLLNEIRRIIISKMYFMCLYEIFISYTCKKKRSVMLLSILKLNIVCILRLFLIHPIFLECSHWFTQY